MFRQAGRVATIGALCCAIGLQWVALQSVAWTSMLIQYSKRGRLCQAIAQTFDGAHPCSLCHVVASGKASEKKKDVQSSAPRIDIICVASVIRLMAPFVRYQYITGNFSVSEIQQSPPVPPPRLMAI